MSTTSAEKGKGREVNGTETHEGGPIRSKTLCYVDLQGSEAIGVVMDSMLVAKEPVPRYQYYVHVEGTDKRLDRWVDGAAVRLREKADPKAAISSADVTHGVDASTGPVAGDVPLSAVALGKRKRIAEKASLMNGNRDVSPMPNFRDEAPQAHAVRNIDRVSFGAYDIKTWYYSPYPLEEEDGEQSSTVQQNADAGSNGHQGTRPARNLWVCEGCFKYMRTFGGWKAHTKICENSHPPGKKVYQRGAHTIWEVTGEEQKLYGQNLSLFGKLFIDHKTIYFDVEPFNFYVLTDATTSFDHPIGFFSRERVSYDDYNLACIVTFPPYQKKGYGTLMIEFSYYLSALNKFQGTPERPLSDLGLKGYLSFWSGVVLRTVAIAFNMQDLPIQLVADSCSSVQLRQERFQQEVLRVRRLLAGLPAPSVPQLFSVEGKKREEMTEAELAEYRKRLRLSRGWAGEDVKAKVKREKGSPQQATAGSFNADSTGQAPGASQGSDADVHAEIPDVHEKIVTMDTTLTRLAHACNLRVDDVAFALAECGLLSHRVPRQRISENGTQPEKSLMLSHDAVKAAILSRSIKRPLLDLSYVI